MRSHILPAVATILLIGACSSGGGQTNDDAFISELSGDTFWKSLDRTTAIDAGHEFCDAVVEANERGATGIDAVRTVVARYGLKPGPVLVGAAKRNYCPDVNLG
jgi:hypothetical protein